MHLMLSNSHSPLFFYLKFHLIFLHVLAFISQKKYKNKNELLIKKMIQIILFMIFESDESKGFMLNNK